MNGFLSNMSAAKPRIASTTACLLLLTLVSCSTQTGFHTDRTPVELEETFSVSGEESAPVEWWTAFDDNDLDTLVNLAMTGNLNLRGTWDRLDQARAVARKSGADLYPSLDLHAGGSRSRTETTGQGATYRSDLSLSLAAGYEIDLWGRIRSTRDAAAFDALAGEQDLRAAAITLTAQVADAWYRFVEQRGQMKLLDEQIKTNEEYLELVTLRFRRGLVPAVDVLQQRQLTESKRGERARVEAEVKVIEHQLAVLMGRSPGAVELPKADALPELPGLPKTGVPADLLRKRPDVRSAYFRVQAADRRLAAAIADKFPKISLSAQGGTSAEHVRDLFENWFASLAANLVAPVLDGGRRSVEVDRTRAATSEALNRYGQTVLDSLKEVEDALARETQQRKLLDSLRKQLDLSRKSAEQTRERYAKGTESFLRVLTTLLNHQNLERTFLRERRMLIQHRISLYRALGGGWEMQRPIGATGATDSEGDVKYAAQ